VWQWYQHFSCLSWWRRLITLYETPYFHPRHRYPHSRNDPPKNSMDPAWPPPHRCRAFPLLFVQMGYGLLCGLWVWRRRTNRRPCCLPVINPSTSSSWTARPDGSGRWNNRMAGQHLPRDLVRPISGQQQLAETTKKTTLGTSQQ